ncbi:MAG TPA: hypothetical protein VF543_15655 [Pyrinomonadaceae bacterium]|jgi:hypothetical protein
MKAKSILICIIFVLVMSTTVFSQQPGQEINVAPNAPKDRPVDVKANEAKKFEEAIKPYIEMARKTYPQAKERFLKGLPPKHTFFITTRLYDSARRFEQVFIAVKEIKDGRITGLIWSDIQLVAGYKQGDSYTFPESELIDWTISKPDGTEEGNFVGKFLDTYQTQSAVETPVWGNKPATPERISQRIEEAAIKYQANAPIPRVALYDIAYPHNNQEITDLDGNAVILITALSQVQEELPLKRVYVLMDGKEIELRRVKLILSEQSAANSQVAKTFGPFRADALYLLPVYLRMKPAALMIDFGNNQTSIKAATFGTGVSSEVSRLNIKEPTGKGPSDRTLEEFIKREYPGFFTK